jgi:hypothetical protein
MEPQKRARYSKSTESPEIVEILMENDSDEELEELNELIEGSQNVSSPPPPPPPPSSDEEEIEIEFHHRRGTDTTSIHEFTGVQNGISQSAIHNILPETSPLTIFFHFFRQIFAILCGKQTDISISILPP